MTTTSPSNSSVTSPTSEQKEKWTAELAEVREKLHAETARYDAIAKVITERRVADSNLRGRKRTAQERVGDHYNSQPRIFDLLPNDPECVSWRVEHERLEAEVAALTAELRALNPEEHTQEAIKLQASIIQRQYAENNLIRALKSADAPYQNIWERGEISGVH